MSTNCCLSALCFFCSVGVRSGVMNTLLMFGGFEVDLSLVLFLKMEALSLIELRDTFRSLLLSYLCPSRKALVTDTDNLK